MAVRGVEQQYSAPRWPGPASMPRGSLRRQCDADETVDGAMPGFFYLVATPAEVRLGAPGVVVSQQQCCSHQVRHLCS
jgi:hypothetical protein